MKYLLSIVLLIVLLSSCATVEKAKEAPKTLPPPSVGIQSPLVPQMEKEKSQPREDMEQSFSFSLRDAEVKDVIRAVAKQTRYNAVIEPDVEGEVTVDLKEVSLRKALQYILEPLAYTFRIDGRTIYVSKPKIENRIFQLNYIDLRKIGTSSVTASTGGGVSSSGTGGAPSTPGATSGLADSLRLRSETETDIWKSLEENLKNMVSAEGKVVINKQAYTIFVTDYPKRLRGIEEFLDSIQNSLHKQVLIEAQIVEVKLNDYSRQGVNWDLVTGGLYQDYFIKVIQTLPPMFDTPMSDSFRFYVGSRNLQNTYLDLLRGYGKVDMISNPKIVTLNNQRAVIKVATQDVYFDVQNTQVSGVVQNSISYTPRFIVVGLILDVMAQIDNKGYIILNVHPMLTEKVGSVPYPDPKLVNNVGVPQLDVRETDTVVRVREGETLIIGGLIKDKKREGERGAKYLMALPFFGWLFRMTEELSERTELVIFLTPKVVYTNDRI
jgi:MSHA biogenesis protein MshL